MRKGEPLHLARLIAALAFIAALLPSSAAASHNALGELISIGPAGGNAELPAFMRGLSSDGSKVFFESDEALVAGDTDLRQDVYQRLNGHTTLLSVGPNGGNGDFASSYAGSSQDGSKVWIFTSESLVAGDSDGSIDVYEVSGAGTTQVSIGPDGGNAAKNALFDRATPDGSHVFFHTTESLVAGDSDTTTDVYDRTGGGTTWVSAGSPGGNGAFAATFKGVSSDGSRVFLESNEKLSGDDSDNERDVFQRFGGTTTRLSFGPTGGNGDPSEGIFYNANFKGASQDGTKVFIETDETLTGDDIDVTFDVYQRSGTTTTRISTSLSGVAGNGEWDASFRGASADGSKVWFQTNEAMDAADLDADFTDVYERAGAVTTFVSTGPAVGATSASFDASFVGATSTGSRIFISTAAKLLDADTDAGWRDIYERTGITTNFISTGADDPHGDFNAFYSGASSDGSRVFFFTSDSLLASDTDGQDDVYERQGTTTSQLSLGPETGNDPFSGAAFAGNSSDGSRVFMHTGEQLGAPHDTDTAQDVYAALTNVLYPRPGGGTPLRVPLVHAFKQCTSPNVTHISPLNQPSCTPAALDSSEVTTGVVGRASGNARLDVVPGNVSTIDDEADVRINASVSDVRKKIDGTDYTGQLIFSTGIRITDRANGSSQSLSGVAGDTELSLPITCNPTADTTIGGSCSIITTADTLVPNFAREGKRAIVATLRLGLEDAGADGDVNPQPPAPFGLSCPPICGSGDESPFMVQGVFLP